MIYIGACFAAGGKDKEAAAAWKNALIREGDAVALHVMLADAQLRQGRGDLAVDDLVMAQKRWPDNMGIKRRYAIAAMLSGQRIEGLRAMDELIESKADDEASLAIALLVLYDAFESGQAVENLQRIVNGCFGSQTPIKSAAVSRRHSSTHGSRRRRRK